jgi:hypothetical protein
MDSPAVNVESRAAFGRAPILAVKEDSKREALTVATPLPAFATVTPAR